ncbi:hypothetical protein DSL72_001054 [Monilinia vaccinii-corymbosi]|uniref:Uncharacterized protein n=1 Tax=Monilinia vaccinii-corymbosi TaxID=61207 RepID=A0A8A3P9W5_9HELO|nr:hypothetical protein DSL72_001054 [Monilinia vaccinii-corymbosi]
MSRRPCHAISCATKEISTPLPPYMEMVARRELYVEPPVHVPEIYQICLYGMKTFMIGDLPITETAYEVPADWDLHDNVASEYTPESEASGAVTAIFDPRAEGENAAINHGYSTASNPFTSWEMQEAEWEIDWRISSVIERLGELVGGEAYDRVVTRVNYGVEDSRFLVDQRWNRGQPPTPSDSKPFSDSDAASDTEPESW